MTYIKDKNLCLDLAILPDHDGPDGSRRTRRIPTRHYFLNPIGLSLGMGYTRPPSPNYSQNQPFVYI